MRLARARTSLACDLDLQMPPWRPVIARNHNRPSGASKLTHPRVTSHVASCP